MTLRLINVTVRYGEYVAANAVDMEVEGNGLYGIFGPNGSGKSSIIKAVCGLAEYTGRIEICNQVASQHGPGHLSRLFAYVPQQHEFIYRYEVLEVVMMGDEGYRLSAPDSALQDAARSALIQLSAGHLASRLVTELSGGERQLVQLARALNQNTPLLILDEPFAHLDFGHQIALWRKLRGLASQKIIVITSHDPNHIMWFCDSIFVMQSGEMIKQQRSIQLSDIEALYPGRWRAETFGSDRKFIAPDI